MHVLEHDRVEARGSEELRLDDGAADDRAQVIAMPRRPGQRPDVDHADDRVITRKAPPGSFACGSHNASVFGTMLPAWSPA